MPEATHNPQDLEARAEELVAGGPIDVGELAAEAVAHLESSPLSQAATDMVSSPPAPSPTPDLAEAVQKLIEPAAPVPAPSAPPRADKIETLDEQIANLADDLIAGDLADEQGTLQGQVGAPPIPPPPSLPPTPAPVATPAKSVEAPSLPDLKPSGVVVSALPPPAGIPPQSSPSAKRRPARRKPAAGRKAMSALALMGTAVLAVLSGPIRSRPKAFRDLVGWVALWTLFNATCVWVYLLFFRSPVVPPARPAATTSHETGHSTSGGDGHGKPSKASGKGDHGSDKGAHGAPAKKSTKTAAKKPAKDSKAQASHSGGH